MAVKKLITFKEDSMSRTWLGQLYADSKNDISDGMTIEGLPEDYEIEWGSEVITADGDIGQLKSNGEWKWIPGGE